jgi:hypothetical protein
MVCSEKLKKKCVENEQFYMYPHCKDVYGQVLKLHNYAPLIWESGFILWNCGVPHEERNHGIFWSQTGKC